MSWNPRRMLAGHQSGSVADRVEDCTLLWMTEDAMKLSERLLKETRRIPTRHGTPTSGLLVGFDHPVSAPIHDSEYYALIGSVGVFPELAWFGFQQLAASGRIADGRSRQRFPLLLFNPQGWVTAVAPATADVITRGREVVSVTPTPDVLVGAGVSEFPDVEKEYAAALICLTLFAWDMYRNPQAADDAAVEVSTERVSTEKKASRRKASNTSEFQIIDVRRRAHAPSGPRDPNKPPVEHDHRWPVRGFYRDQAYGPGRSLRKRIWIDESVRGPADKPLIAKKQIFKV